MMIIASGASLRGRLHSRKWPTATRPVVVVVVVVKTNTARPIYLISNLRQLLADLIPGQRLLLLCLGDRRGSASGV